MLCFSSAEKNKPQTGGKKKGLKKAEQDSQTCDDCQLGVQDIPLPQVREVAGLGGQCNRKGNLPQRKEHGVIQKPVVVSSALQAP